MPTNNKQPIRMCCACRKRQNKELLVRFVNMNGQIEIDDSHKLPTRGAYLCKSLACLAKAKKNHALERSLSSKISDEYLTYLEGIFTTYEENL